MIAQTEIAIGGKRLTLSNLDKVLYPKAGFSKGQVINYYVQVAPVLLPHLKDRLLTLKRYPDGVEGEFFYEKHCPSYRPEWVRTASVWSHTTHRRIPYCLIQDLASLVWAINLADLELHTSLARAQKLDRPTLVVFDLDPGPGTDLIGCAQVALWLRTLLRERKLACFPKTSGSKGLQIYVPLNTEVTFERTKHFARAVAEELAAEHPDRIVSRMAKRLRRGKVFIDWSQNDEHKTTVCVYSLRAMPQPRVSTPLKWAEIEKALKTGSPKALSFTPDEVLQRVRKFGDLFRGVLKFKQKLPK